MNLQHAMSNDPHRPQYHFLPPANWMNDPNGLIQWQGQYHLFYQYNPYSPWHHEIHWGHAVSRDLVHWQHLPVALTPTPHSPDANGCWSGCAVNNDGVPTLLYSGVFPQVVCMATSDDGLATWQKYAQNPLIARIPEGIDAGDPWQLRDPFVWREGETWYMLMGTRIVAEGGAILLYRSDNLLDWEYLHILLQGDRDQFVPFWTGTVWECPNIVQLGDKHLLIISFQHHETGQLLYTGYYLGTFSDLQFTPETLSILDYGAHFYAPQIFQDELERTIMFGWLWEGRSEEAQRQAGWAGVMSLPRQLSLDDAGQLRIDPVPELEQLRGQHHHFEQLTVTEVDSDLLTQIQGDSLEIIAILQPEDATQFGMKVRCAPDGSEETLIMCDVPHQFVTIERENSSLADSVSHDVIAARQAVRNAPVKIKASEPVRLHIFLDRSVVEVFVNGEVTLSSRIYPTRSDSLGISLFARNGRIKIISLDIWQLNAASEPPPPA